MYVKVLPVHSDHYLTHFDPKIGFNFLPKNTQQLKVKKGNDNMKQVSFADPILNTVPMYPYVIVQEYS